VVDEFVDIVSKLASVLVPVIPNPLKSKLYQKMKNNNIPTRTAKYHISLLSLKFKL
jgi:hypothetical protein